MHTNAANLAKMVEFADPKGPVKEGIDNAIFIFPAIIVVIVVGKYISQKYLPSVHANLRLSSDLHLPPVLGLGMGPSQCNGGGGGSVYGSVQISVTGSRYERVWANVISVTGGGVSNFQKKTNYVMFSGSAHKTSLY